MWVSAEDGTAVEAEPTEEEEENTNCREWKAVWKDRLNTIFGVFATAWAEDNDRCKSGEATEGVDEGGTGEVNELTGGFICITTEAVEPAAAPFP